MCLAGCCLLASLAQAGGPVFTVTNGDAGPFSGKDHRPLQAAIDQARKQGGGEIAIGRGEYLIGQSLKISNAGHLSFRGEEGAVLRLPPLPHAKVAEAAESGATSVRVDRTDRFEPGMVLHFVAPGKVHPFTGKPEPYVLAKIERVESGVFVLQRPLEFPLPAGTTVYREGAPNVFAISGGCEDITIERLTLDGGRGRNDPAISGHVIGCGILAEGRYKYEEGPLGPPVRGLAIRDCVIRGCYGRGVALYSVVDSTIERCTIEDTVDEAIDFDHFAVRCRAVDNRIVRCQVGVEMNDANDCLVENNRFDSCRVGINLWRWCRQPELNVRNRIVENRFSDTAGSVVLLRAGTASNVIEGNIISGCLGNGIVVEGTNQTVVNNQIRGARKEALVVKGDGHVVRGNQIEPAEQNLKADIPQKGTKTF